MLGVSRSRCRRGGLQDASWSLKFLVYLAGKDDTLASGRCLQCWEGPAARLLTVSVTLGLSLDLSEPQVPQLCGEDTHRK